MTSSTGSQCVADAQDAHPNERKCRTEPAIMGQGEAFGEELERDTGHDPSRDGEHASVDSVARRLLTTACNLEPESSHSCTQRLADATKQRTPKHRLKPLVNCQIERECHGESLRDVVNEQSHEDAESQLRICVVRRIGYKTLGQLMQSYRYGGL